MRFCRGEVNGGNRGIFLYEYGVLKLAPVARLGIVLGGRARMGLEDERLVIHARKA